VSKTRKNHIERSSACATAEKAKRRETRLRAKKQTRKRVYHAVGKTSFIDRNWKKRRQQSWRKMA